jgi:hypothetical protein
MSIRESRGRPMTFADRDLDRVADRLRVVRLAFIRAASYPAKAGSIRYASRSNADQSRE